MKSFDISDYQIKTSRTGEPVPVVNGIHLHSVYNPIKEADGLAQNNLEIIKKNSNILILGLAFSYHIDSIIEELKKHHKTYNIFVVEPNIKITEDCKHYRPMTEAQVKIYSHDNVEDLYSNIDLVDFLSERPGVIAHPASFNLNDTFFRNFLTYKANQSVSSITQNIQNEEIRTFIEKLDPLKSLSTNLTNYISEKNQITTKLDHFIIAYNQLTSTQGNKTAGDL